MSEITELVSLQKETNRLLKCILEQLQTQHVDLDVVNWIDFPDHLRKTMRGLIELGGRATASELAKKTKRARAVESGYLNQIIHFQPSPLQKEHSGRKVYFCLKTTL